MNLFSANFWPQHRNICTNQSSTEYLFHVSRFVVSHVHLNFVGQFEDDKMPNVNVRNTNQIFYIFVRRFVRLVDSRFSQTNKKYKNWRACDCTNVRVAAAIEKCCLFDLLLPNDHKIQNNIERALPTTHRHISVRSVFV